MVAKLSLQELLSGKRVRPPLPSGKTASVGNETDDPVRMTPDESAAASIYIEYRDSKGEESCRTITFRAIQGHYGRPETIGAFCHARERYKCFRVDRISEMMVEDTGEVLDPLEHCIALHRNGALKIEDKALTRVMRIVTFMARCDGEFHSLEQTAIDDILGRYFRFFGGDDDAYECARREVMNLAPQGDDVIKAVKWMRRAPDRQQLARFVIESSAQVVQADGRIREEETQWGIELGDQLKRIATA